MIDIVDKVACCGCGACYQVCPKHCIEMQEDEEGFLYPHVDVAACVDCHLCEKVCPELHRLEPRLPLETFAAVNEDRLVRENSSSGGVFSLVAEKILSEKGIVFGAGFDAQWKLVHSAVGQVEELEKFRMSKYVQSDTGLTFHEVEVRLKEGRRVLYSGTPCQIAGLRTFLGKEYENLLTLDIVCHGVPSPGVFRWYLSEELSRRTEASGAEYGLRDLPKIPQVGDLAERQGYAIRFIRFRDKQSGWRNYRFALELAPLDKTGADSADTTRWESLKGENAFLKGFLNDLYLRPSCHDCPVKELRSGSDLTLGDFWGVEQVRPEMDDDRGTSLVMANTEKGRAFVNSLSMKKQNVDFECITKYNLALVSSTPRTEKRDKFFASSSEGFAERVDRICRSSWTVQLFRRVRHAAHCVKVKLLGKKGQD